MVRGSWPRDQAGKNCAISDIENSGGICMAAGCAGREAGKPYLYGDQMNNGK